MRKIVALIAATATLLIAGAGEAAPAMWVIRRGDSTIYLLGTIHATNWKSPPWFAGRLERAFLQSQELWLETTGDDAGKPDFSQIFAREPSSSVNSQLSASERSRLAVAATATGLRPNQVAAMKPGPALMLLGLGQLFKAGYSPSLGVDEVLEQKAKTRGESTKGLETDASQYKLIQWMFSNSVTKDDFRQLHRYLATYPAGGIVKINRELSEWYAGDLVRTEQENVKTSRKQPELYALLYASRNLGFSRQIEARLETPGVVFVAVGAAHFVGPDSVVSLLKRDGIAVERY